jgi:hypothetical protein
VLETGKPLDQRLEDLLRDVVDGIWPRHEPPDPSPDQRLVEAAALSPGLVILGTLKAIQKADRGIGRGHETDLWRNALGGFLREKLPFLLKNRGSSPPRGSNYGLVVNH